MCLSGVKQPCKSLEFVSSHLGSNVSNVSIVIDSTSLSLNEVVTFENYDEINISGGIKDTPTNTSCNLSPYAYTNGSNVSAGFIVNNVSKVSLSNIRFHACGVEVSKNSILYSAVQLLNCGNVTLTNLTFNCSVYNGLFITNSVGIVSILNVNFSHNVVHVPHNSTSGFEYYPTGMYLLLNSSESSTSRYSITHCNFIINQFTSFSDDGSIQYNPNDFVPRLNNDIGSGLGGGMGIVIMENITQTEIVINSSFFKDNKAPWGAGLCVQFQDHVSKNSIQIVRTNFTGNSAFLGGGGVNIRFQKCSQKNIIMFQSVLFSNNVAKYGGGTSVMSRACHFGDQRGHNLNQGIVAEFSKCTWFNNSGNYSPAVDASPFRYDYLSEGFFPLFIIRDSSFVRNYMHIPQNQMTKSNGNFYINSGAFTVTRLSVNLSGKVSFKKNSFSALVLISASAKFGENSNISFIENEGFKGGAILMYGISTLKLTDNSSFEFLRNRALIDGGAIYYETIQPLDFFYGHSCFLQYSGTEKNVHNRNLTLIFDSNTANHSGNSIYASTFYGCFFRYMNNLHAHHNITAFFSYIGNFRFDGMSKAFSSYGHKFVGNRTSVDSIPGKSVNFELKLLDEFNQIIDTNFAVQVNGDSPKLVLKNSFTTGNSTCVYGEEAANGTLIFSQQSTVHKVYFPVYVTLLNCASGYYYDSNTLSCRCAADVLERAYPFMYYCNYTQFRAYIERSHWVGYYPPNETDSLHLYTAFCPSQLCRLSKLVSSNHLLPNTSKTLSDFVCVENRTGTLCGLCKPGFSTLYHSRQLSCSNISKYKCNLGIIYYILSEIIPVSVLFAVIVWFDMSFTSGSINGLIFFSQIQDYITVDFNYYTDADSRMFNQTYLLLLQHGYHLLYGIINMEFLNIEPLSFCLFHNSHVMHILILKYLTTIYAFVLILVLIGFLNYCKCGKLFQMRKRERSVTNGMSAFLVICYVQCARTTFYILMKADLFGNKVMGSHSHVRVTYYGGLPYFKNDHLYYAIPAMLVLLTFVVSLPLYLLCFPLILHLLSLCGLNEHPLASMMLHLLQVNRLKPLLDTFQFSFKDRMRFFAGVYFLYRVAILSVHSSFQGNNELFLDVSVVLIVIFFGINSIAQPYISRKHNVIDSLLLLNLAAINGLTLFCLKSQASMDKMGDINYTLALSIGVLQLILLYLPLFICVCVLIYKILHLFCRRFCSTRSSTWSVEVTDDEQCEMLLSDKANDRDYKHW